MARRQRYSISVIWLFLPALLVLSSLEKAVAAPQPEPEEPSSHSKIWVYFVDHGEKSQAELQRAIAQATVSERSLERRRNRSSGPLTDLHDLPVNQAYLASLREIGCQVKRTSKYLNAASVLATPEQIETTRRLPFVKKIAPVRKYRRKPLPEIEKPGPAPDRTNGNQGASLADPADYGGSFAQLDQIRVPEIHDLGYHGEGVLVAILDTGFNRGHEALDHLDVLAEWDFIFNDSITVNEPEDRSDQHNHGTYTLSALAGYNLGTLIGPAWAATYILAKTERVFEEVEGEEDDFVRALEWADSIGASVVSSSLAYFDWYTWDDMDGNTAVTTIASDIAASKGITVVNSAGNEGGGGGPLWPGILAPADGDSVIAVGAVDASGNVAAFSSRGPTRDGRIKPDVMARGVSTWCASPLDSLTYNWISGTSLAAPLVAGACALLVQTHPLWGPIDIRTALRKEASNSATPNNDYGWGIIDAYKSMLSGATGVLEAVSLRLRVTGEVVRGTITNDNAADMAVDIAREQQDLLSGRWSSTEVINSQVVPGSSSAEFYDGIAGGGLYRYRLQMTGDPSRTTLWQNAVVPVPFVLRQSAPNPFVAGAGSEVAIEYLIGGMPSPAGQEDISSFREVSLDIFDVRGARVHTLVYGLQTPRAYRWVWDGRDDRGNLVSSGIYFYRLSVDGRALSRKMVVIRR